MTFADTWLNPTLLQTLTKHWYIDPTPIQAQAIPIILQWKDVFGCAQTGTGKTAAFALPTLQLLWRTQKEPKIRTLVLTPTRELAVQIWESFDDYGKDTGLTNTVIFGGVTQTHQVKTLRKWVDILIATPGRLLDLINQKYISLAHLEIFILDEADRMLDMWFINDVKKIMKYLPNRRQTLFFSATMAPTIMDLAQWLLHDPVHIEVTPNSSTVDMIEQSLYTIQKEHKKDLLLHLLQDKSITSAVIFSKTKHGANKIEKFLVQAGISTAAIHGNKSQAARQWALSKLKEWKVRILVATDVAARGIDIDLLSHVIIYDVPLEPESYVHRIGRTGRAGASGQAIMFCEPEEIKYLRQVLKLIQKEIPLVTDHPYHQHIGLNSQPPKSQKEPSQKWWYKHRQASPAKNRYTDQRSPKKY